MKVIKKINNNVALCIDKNGKELIAFGKGIGFREIPYTIQDLSIIQKTFYSVKSEYIPLFKEVKEDLFNDVEYIIRKIRASLDKDINDSLFFVLLDHINFAIKRARSNIYFRFSITNEISQMYEPEMKVGKWIVNYINQKYKVKLLSDEAAIIAVHIVENYDDEGYTKEISDESKIIDDITDLLQANMKIRIDKGGFNYSRFISHLSYLLKRQSKNKMITSDNQKMFDEMKEQFPDIYKIALSIRHYLAQKQGTDINDEELLYLMIHINRMIDREDCNH